MQITTLKECKATKHTKSLMLTFLCFDIWCLKMKWHDGTPHSTHLTTSVAKFPAAVDVWGSWHGIANASHSNVGKGQVDYNEVGGSTELFELHKHQQHHNVARQTDNTWERRAWSIVCFRVGCESQTYKTWCTDRGVNFKLNAFTFECKSHNSTQIILLI